MTTPFADLEAELNAVAFAELANATADFGSGKLVDGVFDAAYRDPFNVGSSMPIFVTTIIALGSVSRNAAVTIKAVAYTVGEIQSDGRGAVTLILERA